MANKEHLDILLSGVDNWNKWRAENPDIIPDLKDADLECENLVYANLGRANLEGALFIDANLERANLNLASLINANMERANLKRTNMKRAILLHANMKGCCVKGANMKGANLDFANLEIANMKNVNLAGSSMWHTYMKHVSINFGSMEYANLKHADLKFSNLVGANMSGCNMRDCNLAFANMKDVNLTGVILPHFQIQQEGKLIVWKALNDCVAKLEIPDNARRTACLVNRKCRAEFVRVLWISNGHTEAVPNYGGIFRDVGIYRVGELIFPDHYNPDIRTDCSHGIHFFLTREEAEEWLSNS